MSFEISFLFSGKINVASVSEIKIGGKESHFFVTPNDKELEKKYGTVMIRYVPNNEFAYTYGFPNSSAEAHNYMNSVATSLRDYVYDRDH